MKRTRTVFVLGVAVMLLMTSTMLLQQVTAQESAQGDVLDGLELVTGSTDRFGGGDFVALDIKDARFAVLYGNDTNPNHIIIASEFTRFLGGADVYGQNGNLIETVPIPVRTVFTQRFMFFVEFADRDNDMLLDNATEGNLAGFRGPEPVKAVSLNKSWERSDIVEGNDENGNRTWDFTLTIRDVAYDRVWESDAQGLISYREGNATDGQVEEISLIFHISASEKSVETEVPWFSVTTHRFRRHSAIDVERTGNRTFNGTTITADVKYDHYIEGWDFADANNSLALETHAFFGTHRHQRHARNWHEEGFENRIGAGGEARLYDQNQAEISTDFEQPLSPRLVSRNEIRFNDNWERVGRLRWVSDVDVTNNGITTSEEMRFQIHGGARVQRHGFNGHMFNGFVVRGAFVYPAGEVLFHDPAMTTDVLFLDIDSVLSVIQSTYLLVQVSIAIAAIAAVVGYKFYSKLHTA